MPRNYRHIKKYEKEIIENLEQGYTLGKVGNKFVFAYKQMRDFKTPHYR